MSSSLFENYFVYNNGRFELLNIFIEDGKIVEVSKESLSHLIKQETKIFDGMKKRYILPGFFDMHVHFRDFKQSNKETIEGGAYSAFRGGYTGVAIMPNTQPSIDNPSIVQDILERAKKLPVDIYPFGTITKGRRGEELSEMFKLKESGVIGFSDDGDDVYYSDLMYNAINYASMTGLIVNCHCEDKRLADGGHINEGKVSSKWGIKGIPDISESISVFRNIAIAEFLDTKIHISHVSTKAAIDVIRFFKSKGVKVTAETTPHYFSLTEDILLDNLSGNYKMNPPLRTQKDKQTVIEALKDGTLDAIATDHAPHTMGDKLGEFENASFGIVGLETSFSVTSEILYHQENLGLSKLVDLLSNNPRKILGLPLVKIDKGEDVNFVIVDMNEQVTVDVNKFVSKAKNSPFHNMKFRGKVVATFHKQFVDNNE